MWNARTKDDLIIEVWEKLDCESVGAAEVETIEKVVADVFGRAAVDSPMVIARLVADEGAELRHSELMDLYVSRASERTFEPAFAHLVPPPDLLSAEKLIRELERLRLKYHFERDNDELRSVRQRALDLKKNAAEVSADHSLDAIARQMQSEIVEWLTIWLQTPELFGTWVAIRQASQDFKERFGRLRQEGDQ
jgi:hypothetical protein